MSDPKPIRDDAKDGQWSVVVAWWVPASPLVTKHEYRDAVESLMRREVLGRVVVYDLDVAVHEHGASGERSEHEGTFGLDNDCEHAIWGETDDGFICRSCGQFRREVLPRSTVSLIEDLQPGRGPQDVDMGGRT